MYFLALQNYRKKRCKLNFRVKSALLQPIQASDIYFVYVSGVYRWNRPMDNKRNDHLWPSAPKLSNQTDSAISSQIGSNHLKINVASKMSFTSLDRRSAIWTIMRRRSTTCTPGWAIFSQDPDVRETRMHVRRWVFKNDFSQHSDLCRQWKLVSRADVSVETGFHAGTGRNANRNYLLKPTSILPAPLLSENQLLLSISKSKRPEQNSLQDNHCEHFTFGQFL